MGRKKAGKLEKFVISKTFIRHVSGDKNADIDIEYFHLRW